jgi:tetratricopeptide (TPR) repeat protein
MIVRNEESELARCLESVQGVVDETVVVDTGSADRSREIASSFGASVIRSEWRDDFSLARNLSLERATGEWILVLDADEELESGTRTCLRETLRGAGVEGIRMRVRNFQPPGEICRYYDSRLARLFRNWPTHRYEGIIHEQITPSILRGGGRLLDADLTILHHGYIRRTVQGGRSRLERNLRLLESALAASPDDPYLHFQYGSTLKMASEPVKAQRHFELALSLDGSTLGHEAVGEAYMKLAQLHLAAARYEIAATLAEQSRARNPFDVLPLYVLALARFFLGNVGRAYPLFLQILQSDQDLITNRADLETVLAYCRKFVGEEAASRATP